MEYIDNYPNGYKDGYSSADDPERKGYGDQVAAAKERERHAHEMAQYNAGLAKEKAAREKVAAERERQKWAEEQARKRATQEYKQREEAVGIMVEKNRKDLWRKNPLARGIQKLQKKSFEQNKTKIIENAERKVSRMTSEEVEQYIEINKGR